MPEYQVLSQEEQDDIIVSFMHGKERKRGWRPWKATKIEVLDFIHLKEAITRHDLMERFNYTYGY